MVYTVIRAVGDNSKLLPVIMRVDTSITEVGCEVMSCAVRKHRSFIKDSSEITRVIMG